MPARQPRGRTRLRAGHPWLFESSIQRQSHAGKPGDLAVVFDQKRRFLAIGLYDPTSPLRLRVLQQGTPVTIDQGWFRELHTAAQRRSLCSLTATPPAIAWCMAKMMACRGW
ncbi:MAG: hypothetical protein R3E79_06570 [Caldilineaceae bacterium]